jgi:CRP/FNR family transcriptional regulator
MSIASQETYQDGEIIIEEGTLGDWVYMIQSGKVEISKMIGGKRVLLTTLGPGEFFGELGFLGDNTRTATALAIGETSLGIIDRASLEKEFSKLSPDFKAILVAVAERYKQMIDRTIKFASREEIRTQKTLSLSYQDKKSFVEAYTENVSDRGLFIRTENPLGQGARFLLNLQLPGLSDPMQIKCEVAWTREERETADYPTGMGVRFLEMTKEDNRSLKEYLSQT